MKLNKTHAIFALSCAILCLLPACVLSAQSLSEPKKDAAPAAAVLRDDAASQASPPKRKKTPASSKAEPEPVRLTLLAAGDNLIHDVIYQQAFSRTDGEGYNFSPLYERLQDDIAAADIAFINQETIMDDTRPPSGYPAFNTPSVMASQLADAGFDIVNLANNHMLDMGIRGLEASMDVVDGTQGLTRIGAWREGEDKTQIAFTEAKGVTFAFVGFAEYTNVGGASMYRDQIVYTDDWPVIEAQLAAARERADVVVVSVHFGTENVTVPNQAQEVFAQRMNELGADIVLGHHPHMVQPVEVLEGENGHRTLVFYSLGNFVSAQSRPDNLIGLMPIIPIEKSPDGEVSVGKPLCRAVVTHYGSGMRNLSLYPLEEYSSSLAVEHGVNAYGIFSMEGIRTLLKDTIPADFVVPGR